VLYSRQRVECALLLFLQRAANAYNTYAHEASNFPIEDSTP
jgi:hypothetical protein